MVAYTTVAVSCSYCLSVSHIANANEFQPYSCLVAFDADRSPCDWYFPGFHQGHMWSPFPSFFSIPTPVSHNPAFSFQMALESEPWS